MAIADILAGSSADPYSYGGYGGDIERKLRARVAQQLMLEGSSAEPVKHWTQGLARVAQALSGGYMAGQIGAEEGQDELAAARERAIPGLPLPGQPQPGPVPAHPLGTPTMGPRPQTAAALVDIPPQPPSRAPTNYGTPGAIGATFQQFEPATSPGGLPAYQPTPESTRVASIGASADIGQPALSNPTPAGAIPVQTQSLRQPPQAAPLSNPTPAGATPVPTQRPVMLLAPQEVAQGTPPIPGPQAVGPSQFDLVRINRLLTSKNKENRLIGEREYQSYLARSKEQVTQAVDPETGMTYQVKGTGERIADPTKIPAISEVNYALRNWQKLGFPDPNATDQVSRDFWQAQNAKRLGGPGNNISFSTEKKGQEALATKAIEGYTDAQMAGRESQKRMAVYDRMEQAARAFRPSATAELRLSGQRILQEFGLPVSPSTSEGEIIKMLGQQLAIHAQPKGQGAVSNFEREMYAKSLPNMLQTEGGFSKAIEISRALEKFDYDTAKIWRDSAEKNNGIPNYLEVQRNIAALGSPLTDSQMRAIKEGAGAESSAPAGGAPSGGNTTKTGVKWSIQ